MDDEAVFHGGFEVEYRALRDESLKRIELRQQTVSIALTIAGVFLGVGIGTRAVALVYPPLALALAISYQESGWNHRQVSVANAIGLMQVIPASGDWAGQLIGREINLLDPQDNITAGVVIIRAHLRSTTDESIAIAAYYQGMTSVRTKGMYSDTRAYVRNVQALRAKFG